MQENRISFSPKVWQAHLILPYSFSLNLRIVGEERCHSGSIGVTQLVLELQNYKGQSLNFGSNNVKISTSQMWRTVPCAQ